MSDEPARINHVVELPRDVVLEWFGPSVRFGRMGVDGKGSCFFHSVCLALNKDGYVYKTEEEKNAYAEAFRCSFETSFGFDEYTRVHGKYPSEDNFMETKKRFCRPSSWANEDVIRHVSRMMGINILFLDMGSQAAYCGIHNRGVVRAIKGLPKEGGDILSRAKALPTIFIAWIQKKHFEPIVRILSETSDGGSMNLRTFFMPFERPEDMKIVSHFVGTYVKECGERVLHTGIEEADESVSPKFSRKRTPKRMVSVKLHKNTNLK
jgi:hypothetical protein